MIEFGITQASLRAITDLLTGFRERWNPALKGAAEADAVLVAEQLNRHVIEEFKAGVDKEGVSHDKSGYTVGTFHVEPHPMGAFVVLGGAAGLVEFGSKPHVITAKADDGFLRFKIGDEWVQVHAVNHPGYRGDPYIERAIARTDLGDFAARIVGAAYAAMFLRSVRA